MRIHFVAFGAVALLGIGFLIAWGVYRPKPAKPEPPAPAVRQKDGSLELERAPSGISSQAPAGSSPIKPAQAIPKGAKVERIVEVTVDPNGNPSSGRNGEPVSGGSPSHPPVDLSRPGGSSERACPSVTVDLTLIRMPDKTQRVLASSPNGEVIGGIDVPIQAETFPRIQRWTVQGLAGYDAHVGRNVFGGQVSYSKGPFVVSGGIIGGTGFVGAGVRF